MKYHWPLLLPLLYVQGAVASYEDDASTAIKTLQDNWYNASTGLWNGLWWESGNMVETIAKFGLHDANFKKTATDIVANSYAKSANQDGAEDWKNDYYDDMGWWAMGWIASYDLTGDAKYLNTAKDIFEDMTGGWTTPCNGGIWWDKKKSSIASISNELFLSIAAHLANRVTGNDKNTYLHWALAEWDWFSKPGGAINSENLINDGVDKGTCKNDGKTVYTYNQGVILGGLAELAKATGDSKYTDQGKKIAQAVVNKLTNNGILTEQVATLDEQGAQFKGAFVRGLSALNEKSPTQFIVDFLKRNADSAWEKAKGDDGVIGPNWAGANQGPSSTTSHASGVDILVAAAQAA